MRKKRQNPPKIMKIWTLDDAKTSVFGENLTILTGEIRPKRIIKSPFSDENEYRIGLGAADLYIVDTQ